MPYFYWNLIISDKIIVYYKSNYQNHAQIAFMTDLIYLFHLLVWASKIKSLIIFSLKKYISKFECNNSYTTNPLNEKVKYEF